MKANKKIVLIMALMLIVITFIIMAIVAINFRDYAYQSAEEKSKIIAELHGKKSFMLIGYWILWLLVIVWLFKIDEA